MKFRIAIPVALAALFLVGTAPIASAKMAKKSHRHMLNKSVGPGISAKTGTGKQSATGGPSGGSTKSATGAGQ